MTDDTSAYTIEATETSLAVLEALVDHEGPVGVTRLADQLDSSKSVVHNHVSTLRARGYVVKVGDRYRPSLRTLQLGNRTRDHLPVYRAAISGIDNLAAATGETTTLFVREENWGVPVYVVNGIDGRTLDVREGGRVPLPANAPGKAILSSLPDDAVDAIIDAMEPGADSDATVSDPDELRTQIRRIRDDEVAFSREERGENVVSVATSLPTGDEHTTAALGIHGPSERLSGRYLEEDITGQVLSTAKSIRVELTDR